MINGCDDCSYRPQVQVSRPHASNRPGLPPCIYAQEVKENFYPNLAKKFNTINI